MPNKVFISYRRSDLSPTDRFLIHDGLEKELGNDTVFLDMEDLHGGDKWMDVLTQAGSNAKVCMVMIGPKWYELNEAGNPRIQDPGDWVRKEIELAIGQNLYIMPILFNGGPLPKPDQLPTSLQPLLSNQAITLDIDKWNIYRLPLLNDLKRKLGPIDLSSSPAVNDTRSILRSRALVGLAIAIVMGLIYLIYEFNKKGFFSNSKNVEKLIDSNLIQPITNNTIDCIEFLSPKNLKTIFFPLITNDDQKIEYSLAGEFTRKCESYRITDETKVFESYRGKPLTLSDQKNVATRCLADLFFGGQIIKENNKQSFNATFGLTQDTFQLLEASDKTFRLEKSNVSLQELTGGEAIDSLYNRVLQVILGFVLVQNKEYYKAVKVLKDLNPESLQDDKLRNNVYRIMADACYAYHQPDSAIFYLNKANPSQFSVKLELKKSILAEETKQPDLAIQSYTRLIDSSKLDKNILYERRADRYKEVKEYQKSIEDYEKAKPNATPEQSRRIDTKVIEVNKNIELNKSAISKANESNLTTPSAKIKLGEQLLENGDAAAAHSILTDIPVTAPEFKKAQPLLLESQIKLNQINVNNIPKVMLDQNTRLRVAARIKQ